MRNSIILVIAFVIFTIKLDFTKLNLLQLIYAAYYFFMIIGFPIIFIKKIIFPKLENQRNDKITLSSRIILTLIFCALALILDYFKFMIFKGSVMYVDSYFIYIVLLFGSISIFTYNTKWDETVL